MGRTFEDAGDEPFRLQKTGTSTAYLSRTSSWGAVLAMLRVGSILFRRRYSNVVSLALRLRIWLLIPLTAIMLPALSAKQCSYQLTPPPPEILLNFLASGGGTSYRVNTAPGCQWSVASLADWIIVNSPGFPGNNYSHNGTGPGTVDFQITQNSGGLRVGYVVVAGYTIEVEQQAYASSPPSPNPSPAPSPSPTPTPPVAPTIAQFTAQPNSIQRGQSSTLQWRVEGHTTIVSIDQGVGAVPAAGMVQLAPTATTVYTLTATGPGGTATATTTISVTALPPPTLPPPVISTDKKVENAASFIKGQGVSPGSLVSIFGLNFTSTLLQAKSVPLPTSLADISVTFNGIPAPILAVAHDVDSNHNDQINAQVPWNVIPFGSQTGTADVVVTVDGVASPKVTIPLAFAAPGLFYVATDTTGVARPAAYNNADYTLPLPLNVAFPPYTSRPAKVGDPNPVVLLATGLGLTTATPENGAVNPYKECETLRTPTVLVGGVPAQVIFSGLSPQFPGVYQLNIILQPGTPSGDAVPVQIQMNGITTTDSLKIAVSN